MRALVALLCVLLLAGCHQAAAPKTSATSSSSAKVVKKAKKQAVLKKASLDDLMGHYFVDAADPTKVLQFTPSTSGYFMDIQESRDGQDFKSVDAGIFNANITTDDMVYNIQGTAQPNAAASHLQFKKLTNTSMQQLPDGPIYKRVKNDDLNTIGDF